MTPFDPRRRAAESVAVPRLLVATNHFPPRVGGVERFVHGLVRNLPPEGVAVLAPWRPDARAFDADQPYPVFRWGGTSLAPTTEAMHRLTSLVRETDAELLLFGHAVPLGLIGPRLRERHGIPYATLTHGAEALVSRLPWARRLLRHVFSRAEVVFSVSRAMRDLMRPALPDDIPTAFLPPGVDAERFHPLVDPGTVLERFHLTGRPVVLSVSRMVKRKGHDVLVRAWPRVLRRFPEAALLLVGDGPQRRRLEQLQESLGLERSVIFAGPVEMEDPLLPALYSAADVFAMPARSRLLGYEREAFGIVYLEAAAAAVPAVAGDSGGVADAVVDGETGVVVDGRREEEVADALVDLLEDGVAAKAMGLAGRARVEGSFAWPRIIERMAVALAGARIRGG